MEYWIFVLAIIVVISGVMRTVIPETRKTLSFVKLASGVVMDISIILLVFAGILVVGTSALPDGSSFEGMPDYVMYFLMGN